jgi:hypothetical protein
MRIVAMDGAPLPSSTPSPITEDLKYLRATLRDFESRAVKWRQFSPNLITDIEQSLKPSLEQLEQTWQALAHEWNTHLQDYEATLHGLQETLQSLQPKPAPRSRPRVDRYSRYSISSQPSLLSRLWRYLNEPAIQAPLKSKRPESFN